MGRLEHPDLIVLSAYLDGEDRPEDVSRHLKSCLSCTRSLSQLAEAERAFTAAADMNCAALSTLLSASLDGEVGPQERALLDRHLAGCTACPATLEIWRTLGESLAALPLATSSPAVDRAIARKARRPAPRPSFPRPALGGGLAVAAAALILAIALRADVGLPPVVEQDPGPLVAAASEQIVVNSATNRIYVLQPELGAVAIYDATTKELVRSLRLGGRLVAIAVDPETNAVYVLDAEGKVVTEIDGSSETVTGTTTVTTTGTPTTLNVDSQQGRLVIGAKPGPSTQSGASRGEIVTAPIGAPSTTATSTLEVEPQRVVLDAARSRMYVTSSDATLVLDARTFAVLERLPGPALDVAVAARSGMVALLRAGKAPSLELHGAATVAVSLPGDPKALLRLPDGGFAVLVETARGGQILTVAETGEVLATLDTPAGSRFAYDPGRSSFVVYSPRGFGTEVVMTSPEPEATLVVPTREPTATPEPEESLDATEDPEPSPTPDASPSPAAAPAASPAPERPGDLPPAAVKTSAGIWRLDLPDGRVPLIAASRGGAHMWFVDQHGALALLSTRTGAVSELAQLPVVSGSALIAVGSEFVYVFDPELGRILFLDLETAQLGDVVLPFGSSVVAMAVAPSGSVWFAANGAQPVILEYDVRSGTVSFVALPEAVGVRSLFVDGAGRVWIGASGSIAIYDPSTRRLSRITLPGLTVSAIGADSAGTVWVAADGVLLTLRSDRITDGVAAPRLAGLVTGPGRQPWTLSRTAAGVGLAPVPAVPQGAPLRSPVGAVVLDDLGRAWYTAPGQAAVYFTDPLAVR